MEDSKWFGLEYIAASPALKHGGFHPEAVHTAKMAIAELERLTEVNALLLQACKDSLCFIRNGIEMGYIRMPTFKDDTARLMPAKLGAVITLATGELP